MNPYQVGILVIKKVQGNMQIRDRHMYVVRVVPPTARVGIIAANAARASGAGRQAEENHGALRLGAIQPWQGRCLFADPATTFWPATLLRYYLGT